MPVKATASQLPDEADDDGTEEKERLQELRRWKRMCVTLQMFVTMQTRNAMERMEQLTARVWELEVQRAKGFHCCSRKPAQTAKTTSQLDAANEVAEKK